MLRPESNFMQKEVDPHASVRLFCLPYAGSGASLYQTWGDYVSPDIDILPIQLPGREDRAAEAPYTHMGPLVRNVAQALRPYLDRPFAIFGHSAGALISFELTRELRQRTGATPVHLFVSGQPAPQLPLADTPIHQLPDQEFKAVLRQIDGTPEEALRNNELMQILLPGLRADFAICETYVYRESEPLHCPITAFGGIPDPRVTEDHLKAWQAQTTSAFSCRLLEGGHFYLRESPDELLQAIEAALL